ncbi:MAG: NTP transferase domain-containing protein [Rhodothermaceae bacterium]
MTAKNINEIIQSFSQPFDYKLSETAIILAAGHGKRIKSNTSKMLHKVWDVPTVERVFNACSEGLEAANKIVVVGTKAEDVVKAVGEKEKNGFAYQEVQNGTGHAVQVALEGIDKENYDGIVYILLGDMGLFDADTMKDFREAFINSNSDMMVLTGLYEGEPGKNAYGRIVRVKGEDINGIQTPDIQGNVIEIKEHKDILALDEKEDYILKYAGKSFKYTREELINNNEFNSGVFAFKFKPLVQLIEKIQSNNVQNEIYLTDLIALFNEEGLKISAASPKKQYVLMGFNDKSVLQEMNEFVRELNYGKIKNIVEIKDPNDFFIAEDVIADFIKADENGILLDIKIGKGAYIGKGVKLGTNVSVGRDVRINGSNIKIGNNVKIRRNSIIEGNVEIGSGSDIRANVILQGSDKKGLKIGENVKIDGISKITNCEIENNVSIEHCVLENKKIKFVEKEGKAVEYKFILPEPEGIEHI